MDGGGGGAGGVGCVTKVLEKGRPAPKYDWALEQMFVCEPDLVAGILPDVLRASAFGGDSREAILAAFNAAAFFWDQRILQTLLDIAEDPAAQGDARIEAVALLSVYLDPHAVPAAGFRGGLAPDGAPADACFGRSYDAATSRPVDAEPTSAFREAAVARLRSLSQAPGPPDLRGAFLCAAGAGS